MSAEDLAAKIGNPKITRSVIANIESGRKRDPSTSELIEIAHALDIPLVALLVDLHNPDEPLDLPALGAPLATTPARHLLLSTLSTNRRPDLMDNPASQDARLIVQTLARIEELESRLSDFQSGIYALTQKRRLRGEEFGTDDSEALDRERDGAAMTEQDRDAAMRTLQALGVHSDVIQFWRDRG